MTHLHTIDSIAHGFWAPCDPRFPIYDEKRADRCQEFKKNSYRTADAFVGNMMELADEKTLVVVVSDHGASTAHTAVNLNRLFIEKGLLTLVDGAEGFDIDWRRTKAFVQPDIADTPIYVNLKGRDPSGVVKPGKEYESLREQIVDLLYDLKDSLFNKHPIAIALKKEDAMGFGIYGDRVGDVYFAYRPGYATNNDILDPEVFHFKKGMKTRHGAFLGTFQDLHSILFMAGPGIKKGFIRRKPARIIDVAPTIAYLLNLPAPKDADGSILYDVLEM
jgi:predicted AlkP superfamily phosphohydrolase/phosphomutase